MNCKVCADPRSRTINRLLLTGVSLKKVAEKLGINRATLTHHRQKHLPYKPERRPKPRNVREELEELKYELARLAVLGECGESVSQAVIALREKRQLLELQMRSEGELDATHRKLMLANRPAGGNFEVVFEGGRARTIEKAD